ncbi:cysteine hydrolase family protein [Agarivorans sp. QJM3NY_25]|uniref:cysteine hydrolase family protein n=1 Tax=Agarivorans sp. QJM3NY_25 TaxID=3421430 RepID=UPI003D7F1716
MPKPTTLLSIAGATPTPFDRSQSALLLIDFQQEYITGKLALGGAGQAAISQATKLLNYARQQAMPIFHVLHHATVNAAVFNPLSEQAAVIHSLRPLAGETVIIKSLPNSFYHTELQAQLKQNGRNQLIIAGLMSHMCVTATTIAALELGYSNFICADACASRALSAADGQSLPANMVHQVAMAALGDRYAKIQSLQQLMQAAE